MPRHVALATETIPCISRRKALGGLLGSFALAGGGLSSFSAPAAGNQLSASALAWGAFKERFVVDGRVIDTGNGGVSHSEGQGIGLLAAARNGDRATFDQMYSWTQSTLRRSSDALHSWRYKPNTSYPVDDPNNATDGDLLIALALFNAAAQWDRASYQRDAMAITRDVAGALVTTTPQGTVLLPGISGFTDHRSVTVNPSYYIFPAFIQMAREYSSPIWSRLQADGVSLLRSARFGRWNLPPDWVSISSGGDIAPAAKWPPRFSFDAVRIPLYMCWGGLANDPVVDAIHAFWSREPRKSVPAWASLYTEEQAPYEQSAGMTAIRRYVAAARSPREGTPVIPPISASTDYYSAALTLLVHTAVNDPLSNVS